MYSLATYLFRIFQCLELFTMVQHETIGFSVAINSKNNLESLIVSTGANYKVIFEGSLGKLKEMRIMDNIVLKIKGTEGTLLIDLSEDDFKEMFARRNE